MNGPKEKLNINKILDRQRKLFTKDMGHHIKALSEDFQHKLSVVSEQVVSNSEKLITLEDKMDNMQEDITSIKIDIRQKVSYDEFAGLEKRVVRLESKVK